MAVVKSGFGKKQARFKKTTQFWLGDTDLVLRILPVSDRFISDPNDPYNGYKWQKYHAVVKGYKNSEGKLRMFESTLQKKNKEIITPCAATERYESLKAAYEKARVEGNGPLAKQLNDLIGLKGLYSVEKKWYMNVMSLDGTVGTFGINYSTKAELDREIDRLQAEGVDPLSLENGRFFVFSKSNTGGKSTFSVRTLQQDVEIQGRKLKEDVVSKISPEQFIRVEREMSNLEDLYAKVTPEEVAQIVKESDLKTGKSPACDRFFDQRWKAIREARKMQNATQNEEVEEPEHEEVEASPQVLDGVLNRKEAPAAPVQAVVDELSDEDFFKQIGVTA